MFSFLMVFLTLTLLSLIAIQRSLIYYRREHMYIETRISAMNEMYESILRDARKTIEIIGRRAISISYNHVIETGEGLGFGEATNTLEELIFNVTPSGWDESELKYMENATLPFWMKKIGVECTRKGFDVNITFQDFEVKPYDSWNLLADANISINITDQQGVAKISRNLTINKLISIEYLADPLYPLNTSKRASNTIIKSPYANENFTEFLISGDGSKNGWKFGSSILIDNVHAGAVVGIPDEEKENMILVTNDLTAFNPWIAQVNNFNGLVSENDIIPGITITFMVNATGAMNSIPNNTIILLDSDGEEVWNIENLRKHVSGKKAENSYYLSSLNGPSFLDRLEGNLRCNYCSPTEKLGLESFVNKTYLLQRGITVGQTKTNVDYIYFNESSLPGNRVKGLDSMFRIDNEDLHQEIYNVSDIMY